MELFDTTQQALTAAMRATSARQSALASNIANANTPGYRRQDVDFTQALQAAMGTDAPGAALAAFQPTAAVDASAQAVRPDGNSVDIDRENTLLASNSLEHEALVRVASARLQILQSAMGSR